MRKDGKRLRECKYMCISLPYTVYNQIGFVVQWIYLLVHLSFKKFSAFDLEVCQRSSMCYLI